jgi:predicted RNA-binding protein with PIN domain
VQHPKPLPTPDEHGVFKSSSDLKEQSTVEAKGCSKASKKELGKKDDVEEGKKEEILPKTASGS